MGDQKTNRIKTIFFIGAIAFSLIMSVLFISMQNYKTVLEDPYLSEPNIAEPVLPERDHWSILGSGENVTDPETGTNSGICGIYLMELGSDVSANLTSGSTGYLSGGTEKNNTDLDCDYTKTFIIVVWARGNYTDTQECQQYFECNISSTALSITGTTAPDATYNISNAGEFLWSNFAFTNGGSGYTISRNQKSVDLDILLKAWK